MMLDDALFIKIVREVEKQYSRKQYEELLVESGLYSISTLKDDDAYFTLNKFDLILETLRTHARDDYKILHEINRRRPFSKDVLHALTEAGIELEPMQNTAEEEPVVEPNDHDSAKQTSGAASRQQSPQKEDNQDRAAITDMKKNIPNVTAPQAAIIAAIIGVLGIIVGAFLNPVAEKWINRPEPTPNPSSLAIEHIPFTVYTYDGSHDADPSCCAGGASLQYVINDDLLPEYLLNTFLPDDTSRFGYAGFDFVFAHSLNLSAYKAIEFKIAFGDQSDQIDIKIEDIVQTIEPYHITGKTASENTFVVPLSNFSKVDLKAIRSISYQVDSKFTRGTGKFVVKNIVFTR